MNNVDNWAARGLLRFESDASEWILNVHGGRTQALATHFQKVGRDVVQNGNPVPYLRDASRYGDPDNRGVTFDPTDGNPYAGDYNRTGDDIVELFGSSLTGNIEFENWSLLSISALEMNDRDAETDTDSGPNRIGGQFRAAEVDFKNDSTQVSQELRAEWAHPTQPITIVTGALGLYEKLNADNRFRLEYRTPTIIDGRTQEFEQTTWSWGVYGDLSWDPFETLTVEGGVRYNWDRKDFDLRSCSLELPFRRPGPAVVDCGPGKIVQGSAVEKWTAVTGEASVTYKPTESINFYLKYAHGWKPGQFNGSKFAAQFNTLPEGDPLIPPLLDPADPESVDSFELGFKTHFWDDRIALSGAAFIYRYEDLQVFRLRDEAGSPPVNELINARDAEVAGMELEFEVEPIDGLFVNGAFGWLHSKYNRFTQNQTKVRFTGLNRVETTLTTQDYSGSRLIASPRVHLQWHGALRHRSGPLRDPEAEGGLHLA